MCVTEYELTENNIILGNIDKDRQPLIFLLCAKVSIYTENNKDKSPNLFSLKHLLKQYYIQAKFLATVNNMLENEWHLYSECS